MRRYVFTFLTTIKKIVTTKRFRKWYWISFTLCGITLFASFLAHRHIANYASPYVYDSVKSIPFNKVGLLLGTSKQGKYGGPNAYFHYRIQAASILFKAKKIKKIIVSGDNRFIDYNEPKDMHDALVNAGVPDSCIIYDYAGLRTFDSMLRCKTIFGQDSITVISQLFHNERAIYIGRKNQLACVGFNAQNVTNAYSYKVILREYFSRLKCLLDIYVLNTHPKHGGKKIKVD